MTSQTVHRKARREQRLCVVEGCTVVTGDEYRCKPHAKSHAEYCRKWRGAAKKETRP